MGLSYLPPSIFPAPCVFSSTRFPPSGPGGRPLASGFGEDSVSYEEYLLCEIKKLRGWSFGVRGSPQNTYLVIVEPREVPPTAEIARFGRYTACWRESELSQPRPFPVPPLPQFGSPVRGQSRALMRVLNCLDCTAGYPVHHEGAAHGVADCDSAAMLARSSLCQFTVSFRLRSLRRGDKCA